MKAEPNLQVFTDLGFIKVRHGVKVTPRRRQPKTPTRRQADATLASQSRVEKSSTETEERQTQSAAAMTPPPLTAPRLCTPKTQHAWCDGRMHVPRFVHEQFQRTAPSDFDIMRWYADTDLAWADRSIGDDAPTFWMARWREEHGTTQQTDAQIRRQAQRKRDRESEQPKEPM